MRAIRQTLQVTKAMNLISTAKLRKGRRVLQDVEPFFFRIQKTVFDILSGAEMDESKFLSMAGSSRGDAPGKGNAVRGNAGMEKKFRTAIVVISSDKGLAGGYNANIFHKVDHLCDNVENPVLIIIGAIGYNHFTHSPRIILENFSFKSRLPDLDDAQEIAEYVVSQYLSDMFNEVHIIYTHMYSSVKLAARERQLLPLNAKKMQEEFLLEGVKRPELQFEYLPSKKAVFEHLVPLYLKGIIYGCLVEAYASEQSARMSAMSEASKSAEEMLADLHIRYNRSRQASITQEMTEIIGGAESLGIKN
jgi:F-type H+-transporting ATPase subunit gamma